MGKFRIIRNTVAKPKNEDGARPVYVGEVLDLDDYEGRQLVAMKKAEEYTSKGAKGEKAPGPDNRDDETAEALNTRNTEALVEGTEDAAGENKKGVHAVHKGKGSWDVYNAEGKVIGDNLKKKDAEAMVKKTKD